MTRNHRNASPSATATCGSIGRIRIHLWFFSEYPLTSHRPTYPCVTLTTQHKHWSCLLSEHKACGEVAADKGSSGSPLGSSRRCCFDYQISPHGSIKVFRCALKRVPGPQGLSDGRPVTPHTRTSFATLAACLSVQTALFVSLCSGSVL